MTSDYVKSLIDKAYKEKAAFFDLGDCGLTEVPKEIVKLAPWLKGLNFGRWYMQDGKFIQSVNNGSRNAIGNSDSLLLLHQLSGLTTLYIRSNSIGEKGAEYVSRLNGLMSLYISDNSIGEKGAEYVSRMNGLTSLYISDNSIGEKGAEYVSRMNGLTSLYISDNSIGEKGAESVARMNGLTSLDISSNRLGEKGAESVARMNGLTSLDISSNRLGEKGAEYVSRLNGLMSLYISDNSIGEKGAEYVSRLNGLMSLDISDNSIGEKGAESVSRLTGLTTLYIRSNNIGEKGAESVSRLIGLKTLDISYNSISEFTSIGVLVKTLPQLSYFYFNRDEIKGFPEGLSDDLESLKIFFAATKRKRNNRVKLVLIGNTTAGKSSLAHFLVTNKFQHQEERTHGIRLWNWDVNDYDLKVQIWDFGGQDYYHATHNLFLQTRTLFLLLQSSAEKHKQNKDAEPEQYLPDKYWLGNIRTVNKQGSSIWFIQSRSSGDDPLYLDSTYLDKYKVYRQLRLDTLDAANNKEPAKKEFDYIHELLVQELDALAKSDLPESWVMIRDEYLPRYRKDYEQLSMEQFKKKCLDAVKSDKVLTVDLINGWDLFITHLEACGEIVYFTDKEGLKDIVFLDALKLTKGIYDLISQEVKKNNGELDLSNCTTKNVDQYISVLKAFELIFEKPGTKDVYIAPQYLPENPHTVHFQELIKVCFVIHFTDYMSRSLITRFLVKYAGSSEKNYYWRYGAFFKLEGLNVFVRIDADVQKVYVHVQDGPVHLRYAIMKELFWFFVPEMNEHQIDQDVDIREKKEQQGARLPEKAFETDREVSLDGKDFVTIKSIREAIKTQSYRIRSVQGNYVDYNSIFNQLINADVSTPKRIFLSYSHADKQHMEKLKTHFSALKRSGKVETWSDVEILAGDNWEKAIEDAIDRADIILLLLSSGFMNSDYIWSKEIQRAKESNNPVRIIPVFLSHCDFEETVFGVHKLQGLPESGSQIRWITGDDFKHPDIGYLEVVKGVKKLLD